MRTAASTVIGLVCLCAQALAADTPVKIKTYKITGSTGLELYHSIGRNGPSDGGADGSIAQTIMNLKWNRLLDERDGDCYLVSIRPSLGITMVLPKVEGKLAPQLKADWETFLAGIRKHEDVHVEMIHRLVKDTREATAGAMAQNDRSCAKAKAEVSRRIEEQTAAHKARNRAFDREEMAPDGNVQRLILSLVNPR